MKLVVATIAALVAQTAASGQPLREHDPDTVKSCIEWYNNYDQYTCQEEKYDAVQSAISAATTSTTTTATTTTGLGPSPTARSEVGCYKDGNATSPVMQKRMSPDGGDSDLTLARCRDSCYRGSYRLAGVKNGNECWCSQNIFGDLAADDKECNLKGGGDSSAMCGGRDRLFAYKAQYADGPKPTSSSSATSAASSANVVSTNSARNAASPTNGLSRKKELWLISGVVGASLCIWGC